MSLIKSTIDYIAFNFEWNFHFCRLRERDKKGSDEFIYVLIEGHYPIFSFCILKEMDLCY